MPRHHPFGLTSDRERARSLREDIREIVAIAAIALGTSTLMLIDRHFQSGDVAMTTFAIIVVSLWIGALIGFVLGTIIASGASPHPMRGQNSEPELADSDDPQPSGFFAGLRDLEKGLRQ